MFNFFGCLIAIDAVNAVLDSIDEIQFLQDTPWILRDVESMRQVLSSSRLHSLLTVRNERVNVYQHLAFQPLFYVRYLSSLTKNISDIDSLFPSGRHRPALVTRHS